MTRSASSSLVVGNRASSPRLMARSMLFDLYGGLFIDTAGYDEPIRLGALLQLAADLGVSEVAVRSAAHRMTLEGWLVAERRVRALHYALSPRGHRLMEEGRRRMFTPPDAPWDGRWCAVALSVPESRRKVRDRMRKKLSWLGFGSPSSALYISPRDYQLEVVRLADEFDARPFVQVYRAESLVPADPAELVARAWPNLDLVNRRYAMFLQRFGRELTNARALLTAGDLDDREAFKLRFQLGRAFRAQLFDDPELPSDLLPQNWNGAAARRLFLDHFSLLGPAAHHYVRTVCGIGDGSRRK